MLVDSLLARKPRRGAVKISGNLGTLGDLHVLKVTRGLGKPSGKEEFQGPKGRRFDSGV
jgi:hypothetical protein